MKKSFIAILIGLFLVSASGNVWAGNVVAADLNCTNPAGCVQTNEISDGAVTEPKLALGAVSNGKIADGAVSTGKISTSAITADKLADWSVNGTKIVDYSVTDTKIASGAVTEGKIADGSVTDAKITGPISGSKLGTHTHNGSDITDGTVTESKISDGSVTDAKISGPISAAKLEKPANVIIVAKSGGDFTSIQAAVDSINPTADNPYLIKVMPGSYVECVTMKSYIHLQGSGHNITILKNPGWIYSGTITLINLTDATISGFTILGLAPMGNIYGILSESSSTITITGNIITDNSAGIRNVSSSLIIRGNIIKGNGNGIENLRALPIITENMIINNTNAAISNGESSPIISNNIITENGNYGIYNYYYSEPIIKGNTITGNINGGIINNPNNPSPKLISFNVVDSSNGILEGKYNVKPDGIPW